MIDQQRLAKAVEYAQWVVAHVPVEGVEELDEAVEHGFLTPEQRDDLTRYLSGCMGCETCTVRTVMDALWDELYIVIAGDIADQLELDALGFSDRGLANGMSAVAKLVRQKRSVDA